MNLVGLAQSNLNLMKLVAFWQLIKLSYTIESINTYRTKASNLIKNLQDMDMNQNRCQILAAKTGHVLSHNFPNINFL